MKKYFKMFGAVGLLAGMMMLAGCGDDAASTTVTTTKAITVAAPAAAGAGVTAGGVAVPAATVIYTLPAAAATTVTAPKATGTITAVSIPAATQVVMKNLVSGTLAVTSATGTAINLNVTAPTNGTTFGDTVKVAGTTFAVSDSAGVVDISIAGFDGFALTGLGATVNIPVVKAPDNTVTPQVVALKSDGTTIVYPKAGSTTSYTAATGATSGYVTVTNVTDFCKHYVNPKKANTSGTGSVPIF